MGKGGVARQTREDVALAILRTEIIAEVDEIERREDGVLVFSFNGREYMVEVAIHDVTEE